MTPPSVGIPGYGHPTDMTSSDAGPDQDAPRSTSWWYCLRHQQVEHGASCPATERLGPYASEALARQALTDAAERTEAWDEDPRWNDEP